MRMSLLDLIFENYIRPCCGGHAFNLHAWKIRVRKISEFKASLSTAWVLGQVPKLHTETLSRKNQKREKPMKINEYHLVWLEADSSLVTFGTLLMILQSSLTCVGDFEGGEFNNHGAKVVFRVQVLIGGVFSHWNPLDVVIPSLYEAEEMAHLVKCLPCKLEDLNSFSSIGMKSYLWCCVFIILAPGEEVRQIPRAPWLAGLPNLTIEFPVPVRLKKKRWMVPEEPHSCYFVTSGDWI